MAFASTVLAAEPRAVSLGPIKMELHTWSSVSTDVAGTVTATTLSRIDAIIVDGMEHSAAPVLSGNTATLAFKDPGANAFGTLIILGK